MGSRGASGSSVVMVSISSWYWRRSSSLWRASSVNCWTIKLTLGRLVASISIPESYLGGVVDASLF